MAEQATISDYALAGRRFATLRRFADSAYIWIVSIILVAIGSGIAYVLLGQPESIGINDADITQAYGRNIANGYGYVFKPGQAPLEGSMSLLWTLINAAAYSLTPQPEPLLLAVAGFLTAGAFYCTLLGFAMLLRRVDVPRKWGFAFASVYLLSLFGFYTWSVLSLTDLALWTFLFLALCYTILRNVLEEARTGYFAFKTALLSALMVIARPEAMVLVPALLLLGVVAEKGMVEEPGGALRAYVPGLLATVATATGITVFRLKYFGLPLPVIAFDRISADPIENITYGSRYIFNFIFNGIYSEIFVFGSLFCLFIFAWRSYFEEQNYGPPRVSRALFFLSSVIWLFLALQVLIGGDHYGSFHVYQPIYPLFFVPLFIGVVAVFNPSIFLGAMPGRLRVLLFITLTVAHLSFSALHFHFLNGLRNEFGVPPIGQASSIDTVPAHVGIAQTRLTSRFESDDGPIM